MPSGRVLTVPLQELNTRSQGERKAINKLPEKIILICPRSAERNRDGERESVCVGATASCCWSSRSPFDVMQSALTKCQHQAKEPKPKASPDLTACRVPLRYPRQQDWVCLCVRFSCSLFHFCSPYFILTFLWAL